MSIYIPRIQEKRWTRLMANHKTPTARSAEAREMEMIALATDLAEKQLREGTASAQVITHYLKLATTREQLEKRELEAKIKMLEAKKEEIEAAKHDSELLSKAISAFTSYQGTQYEPGN